MTEIYQITPAQVREAWGWNHHWPDIGELAIYAEGEHSELGDYNPRTLKHEMPILIITRRLTKPDITRWFYRAMRMRANGRTEPLVLWESDSREISRLVKKGSGPLRSAGGDSMTDDLQTTWLDGIDVAAQLSISPSKLRTMARRDEIPAHRIGRSYRFNEAEILEWISAQKIPSSHG